MFRDIIQAESAIKAGDTKTGFEILRSYLAENPDSERAWWVMSGLVQRDERATCLEQVLRINPNNRMARETLINLLASPQKPETKPERKIPVPVEREFELGYPVQAFLYKKGARIYLTLLDGKHLIRTYTSQRHLPQVRDAVKRGELPENLVSGLEIVILNTIQSIQHIGSILTVHYHDGPGERSLKLPFEDEEKARAILGVLTKTLGPDFMIQTKSSGSGLRMVVSTMITLGSVAFIAATIWTIPQVGAGTAGDGWRVRMVSRLLESLGYGGVILICAVMVLAALALSAFLLLKPQSLTELVRRD